MSAYSLEESLKFAILGEFPEDFDQWEMEDTTAGPDREGWTIAHEIARHHDLPVGLDCLDLATKNGTTVAHVLARYGVLPDGFAQWDMADNSGWTVAHEAAGECVLHDGFDQWNLATPEGWTVAQEAVFGKAMARMESEEYFYPEDAAVRNSIGYTVAHFAAQLGYLPDSFDRWELSTPKGWTVAHEAARHGCLSSNFDQWDLTDDEGETVANLTAQMGNLPKDFNQWVLVSEKYRREGWINSAPAAPKMGL